MKRKTQPYLYLLMILLVGLLLAGFIQPLLEGFREGGGRACPSGTYRYQGICYNVSCPTGYKLSLNNDPKISKCEKYIDNCSINNTSFGENYIFDGTSKCVAQKCKSGNSADECDSGIWDYKGGPNYKGCGNGIGQGNFCKYPKNYSAKLIETKSATVSIHSKVN